MAFVAEGLLPSLASRVFPSSCQTLTNPLDGSPLTAIVELLLTVTELELLTPLPGM